MTTSMTTIFSIQVKDIDSILDDLTESYPILKSLSDGEREEAYGFARSRMNATWKESVADVLETFAGHLEWREQKGKR